MDWGKKLCQTILFFKSVTLFITMPTDKVVPKPGNKRGPSIEKLDTLSSFPSALIFGSSKRNWWPWFWTASFIVKDVKPFPRRWSFDEEDVEQIGYFRFSFSLEYSSKNVNLCVKSPEFYCFRFSLSG